MTTAITVIGFMLILIGLFGAVLILRDKTIMLASCLMDLKAEVERLELQRVAMLLEINSLKATKNWDEGAVS